ncbi:sulfatase-like hydrolase/transferase [Pseudonocardia cypriaca]|uniref:Phosphoglycerol transferase MdoB-like AlkP superfamily enzyme n=1 Tax=Pseudonocardia cypriaca TaxID=882449 RepID=A0A543GGT8_9PSEU|nr:sulfatase-like hydrolase/transferase [Pseudonocardia cypriaca]TQM45291.1 phosphoglycerol transferase MdoB-like AlkP superfamily enzyme [Pseudonocardia cypriaca]
MLLSTRPSTRARRDTPGAGPEGGGADGTGRGARHRVAQAILTVLAGLLVFLALTVPREAGQLTPLAFLRIPVEVLVGVAVLLVLPARLRPRVALVGGALLALLTLLRVLQMGFLAVLARPFDPVFDWSQLASGASLLDLPFGATGSVVGAVVVAAVLVVLTALATRRLASCAARHRTVTIRLVAVLTAAWLACFVLGTQLVAPVPVAGRSVAASAYETAQQVAASLHDQQVFDEQAATDALRDVRDADLLTALRGKDVVLTYVESYGRSALENPEFGPTITPILDEGTRRLAAAGFGSRSAFLTSSVVGGGSWLAHATLLSGLRVANEHSFDKLVASDRLTLSAAFRRAGWDTVAVQPSSLGPWPAGAFYGFDRTYDSTTLGNRSRIYDGFQTPDQYTLAAFQSLERGRPDRAPLMAQIPLVSSHWPWAEIPRLLDWNEIGDGSVFDRPGAGQSDPVDAVEADPARMRDGYRRTIEYSLSTLISYVETYGDDNLVFVFLGDHQPAPFVGGNGAGQDVPITIVSRDSAVLDRIAGWGWQDGLRPDPQAPVWPMESFRDRFLTTFSP